MRYIGSKSRLLGFIEEVIDSNVQGVETVCDIFAGTAAVAASLKRKGFTVVSNDIMEYSYAMQVTAVETCQYPRFELLYKAGIVSEARIVIETLASESGLQGPLPGDAARLVGVLNYLNSGQHKKRGFFWNHFSKDNIETPPDRPPEDIPPEEERMFFTSGNAERIDGIRTVLDQWRRAGLVTHAEFYVLLASLIDAADASANTTGVYGAYLKEFGGRQGRALELRMPQMVVGPAPRPHRCYRGDALDCARKEQFDLLYMDPPYNRRDYAANYHVPELIARGWFDARPTLSGKTGMVREFGELRSDFCLKDRCVRALDELVGAALEGSGVKYILLSYNTEGLIPDSEAERIFRSAGKPGSFRRFEKDYKRYRSDSDSDSRTYAADRVRELLYFVEVE